MTYTAIDVDHVSKSFTRRTGAGASMLERFLSIGRGQTERFNALDDVTFSVQAGETVGILGHNGSGKSTMLKCISGTIRPTSGLVRARGSMSALLELGAGFHPDLTGRENVYLNGSILGFSKTQIDSMIDDIVDFSEIPEFIDAQVKHYSSGMFARLGFAVAVNLKPDVLLIDEVLAVGDEAFQRKCLERVRGFQREGRTIVLVTHAVDTVRLFCDKAIVLDEGRLIFDGDPSDGAVAYRHALEARTGRYHGDAEVTRMRSATTKPISITAVEVDPPEGGREAFQPGDDVLVRIRYAATEHLPAVRVSLWLHTQDGILIVTLSTFDIMGRDFDDIEPGAGEFDFTFHELPLLQGRFEVTAVLKDVHEQFEYDRREEPTRFDVVSSGGTGVGRVRVRTTAAHRRTQSEQVRL